MNVNRPARLGKRGADGFTLRGCQCTAARAGELRTGRQRWIDAVTAHGSLNAEGDAVRQEAVRVWPLLLDSPTCRRLIVATSFSATRNDRFIKNAC